MKNYILFFLLLCGCSTTKKNDNIIDLKKNDTSIKLKIISKEDKEKSKYKSNQTYSSFLDSILKTDNVVVKKNIFKEQDTIFFINQKQKFEINTEILIKNFIIKRKFISYSTKIEYITFKSNLECWCYFEFNGKKIEENKNKYCWQYFEFNKGKHIQYNKNYFTYAVAYPHSRCLGTSCRIKQYIIFVNDTLNNIYSHTLSLKEDITGLRFGDINNDGYLDFLNIEQTNYDKNVIDTFKNDETCFYKLRILTFKDGEFQYLKNQKGEDYYILYFIEKPLDINSKIHITSKNFF